MKRVMVFGVFDGVHEGHRSLFREAKGHGDYLIVAVAPDAVVRKLKGRPPEKKIKERIGGLRIETDIDEIVTGDESLGGYEVVLAHRPDVIALGYDQAELKKDIERMFGDTIDVRVMKPFEPEKYHSSILKKKA